MISEGVNFRDKDINKDKSVRPQHWYRMVFPSGFFTWIYLNKQELAARRRELEI